MEEFGFVRRRDLGLLRRHAIGSANTGHATGARICRSVEKVEALAQLFAGFEVRHGLARHGNLVAGARIAPDPLTPPASGERAEAAKLNPRSSRQGRANLLEHRVHDPLDVAQVEMRVGGGQSLDQLGLAHAIALGCQAECAGRRRRVYLNSWIPGISAEAGSISG